ncbi:MAG: OmpA family protein [Deltaproteobacteria bacterium]|nr:OmpA family protein [Deltaproteobacteria bacterium]
MKALAPTLLALVMLASGCTATLPAVQTGQGKLRERIHRAKHFGAMECAPADLAAAQSAYRFAGEEVADGDLARAAGHLEEGLVAVDRALSVGPVCPARGVPVTQIDRDPWLDGDGDGVADADDQCRWQLEDLDGFADGDGCPEPDNDNDGLRDVDDNCPNDAEDMDGWQDEDGCPELDNDEDNFPDADDSCPNDAETVNGLDDEDGCPDFRPLHTSLDGDRLTFVKALQWSGSTAVLLDSSREKVDELLALMNMNPKWVIRIEGHTDNRGDADKLMELGAQRAGTVGQSLIAGGIPAQRLSVAGIGPANPLSTNRTEAGRALNNRIEVYIVEGL